MDLLNLAEEIESLRNSVRRELSSRLRILVVHLLKWRYQPKQRRAAGHSWENTINTQRNDIDDLLHDSPSLGPQGRSGSHSNTGKHGVKRCEKRAWPSQGCPSPVPGQWHRFWMTTADRMRVRLPASQQRPAPSTSPSCIGRPIHARVPDPPHNPSWFG